MTSSASKLVALMPNAPSIYQEKCHRWLLSKLSEIISPFPWLNYHQFKFVWSYSSNWSYLRNRPTKNCSILWSKWYSELTTQAWLSTLHFIMRCNTIKNEWMCGLSACVKSTKWRCIPCINVKLLWLVPAQFNRSIHMEWNDSAPPRIHNICNILMTNYGCDKRTGEN